MDKIAVIIVAGGSGSRMGGELPKQFLPLCGKPILIHTLERFAQSLPEADIVIALPVEQQEYWEQLLKTHAINYPHRVCDGGESRFHSVKNALDTIKECDLVSIHDGVRPLVSDALIKHTIAVAKKQQSAIPVTEAIDSFRIVDTNNNSKPFDRTKLRAVQTPQVFDFDLLTKAYNTPYNKDFTDDASVVEYAYGKQVTLCEGERANIKITTPEDILVAEALMTKQ